LVDDSTLLQGRRGLRRRRGWSYRLALDCSGRIRAFYGAVWLDTPGAMHKTTSCTNGARFCTRRARNGGGGGVASVTFGGYSRISIRTSAARKQQ
jgi:hypothetical protein